MAWLQTCGVLGTAALLACLTTSASAHVTFESQQAAPDASYRAVLRVPHGCDGEATQAVRVEVPDGVIDVRPMPKPGWSLSTSKGAYGRSYDLHSKSVSEGVRSIVWAGGSLPDDHYDEFVFRARLTGDLAGKTVAFPTTQECANGTARWTEIAAPGGDPHALKHPAPTIRVQNAASAQAAASTFSAGTITVEQPWSRATPGGARVGAGYMRITNTGREPDRLVGGAVAVSGGLEVHDMSVGADNVMRMRSLPEGLEIKPGETVELKPGGFHAMFVDLQRPLKEGESLAGTLRFEKAGSISVTYRVLGIGAQGAPAGTHHHH